jgi:putative ABC transport system permease protein
VTRAFTLRALVLRRARLAVAALVVAFGVATVSGVLVFTDTTRTDFQKLFAHSAGAAAVVISGRDGALVPGAVVRRLRRVPGVAVAAGEISQSVTIVGPAGAVVPAGRQASVAVSALPARLSNIRLISGHQPRGPDQVAIDAQTARLEGWSVGSHVKLLTGQPLRSFRVVGIVTRALSGQRLAVFGLAAEQSLYGLGHSVDSVLIAGRRSAAPGLIGRIRKLLPASVSAEPRTSQVSAQVSQVSASFSSLNGGLEAFALIALLIGGLTIFNTFSITAAQRGNELAVLRALGATRGQVVSAGLIEGLFVGIAGAVFGVVLGPLFALVVHRIFEGTGVGLPAGGLVLRASAIAIGLAVGIGVALVAAALPALRATRAAPIEALRVAAGERPRAGRVRLESALRGVLALALIGNGLLVMLLSSGSDAERLRRCGIGGALVLIGMLLAGPLVVSGVGSLLAHAPGARRRALRNAVPALAREHLALNPGRTALSGASLMIGVALALAIGVYVGGLRAASSRAINQTVLGDLAIEGSGGSSVPADVVRAAIAVPDVAAISTLKTTHASLDGPALVQVAGIDPTSWSDVYRFDWVQGSGASLSNLVPGEVLVESDTARADGIAEGSHVTLTVSGGRQAQAVVAGVYRDAGLLRGVTLPLAWFDRLFPAQQRLQAVFMKLSGFVSNSVALASLRRALAPFPGVVARNQSQIAARLRSRANGVVELLYALLVLTVAMSLLGVGGALSLSVQARSQELGLLRAIGMTPAQARKMIRSESTLTAVIAALSGLGSGLGLAWCVVHVLRVEGLVFVMPWLTVIAVIVGSAAVALLAAIGPGRRATRVDVLAAIAHE